MTKIALIGDSHADQFHRFEEHNRILEWIGDDAAARGVDLFLHSGDVWERKSTSTERIAVANYMRQWAEVAPVLVVGGNHDDPLDVEWLGRLRTSKGVRSVVTPEVIEISGVSVACLPWPRKGELLARVGDMSQEQSAQIAAEALRSVLRGLSDPGDAGPRILLSHCSVRGSKVSNSQPPLIGCDFELGLEDLALSGAGFYALGHIHMGSGNEWVIGGAPCVYPGSPRRCNFGEVEPKGYVMIEFNGPHLVGWERITTPCAPMLLATAVYDGSSLNVNESEFFAKFDEGCEIRLRYAVDSDHQAAAKAAAQAIKAKWLEWGAASVQLDPEVNVMTRLRAPEVAKAATLQEALEAHWRSKNYDPGARREALLGKLVTLEGESL